MGGQQASDRRSILLTGATGAVGLPVGIGLARDHDVVAVSRFEDTAARQALERAGIRCVPCDLVGGDLRDVPRTVDHVVNLARPADEPPGAADAHDRAIAAHATIPARLMLHCGVAQSVLHCSSTSMYARRGVPAREGDPITDDRHARRPTYTIAKIGAEAVVRALSVTLGVPATIARLNVPYSDRTGWPAAHLRSILAGDPIAVRPDGPTEFNPIHTDDIARTVIPLLDAAAVPPTLVNWAGDQRASIGDWTALMGDLLQREVRLVDDPGATEGITVDIARLTEIAGPMTVAWRDGIARMVAAADRHDDGVL